MRPALFLVLSAAALAACSSTPDPVPDEPVTAPVSRSDWDPERPLSAGDAHFIEGVEVFVDAERTPLCASVEGATRRSCEKGGEAVRGERLIVIEAKGKPVWRATQVLASGERYPRYVLAEDVELAPNYQARDAFRDASIGAADAPDIFEQSTFAPRPWLDSRSSRGAYVKGVELGRYASNWAMSEDEPKRLTFSLELPGRKPVEVAFVLKRDASMPPFMLNEGESRYRCDVDQPALFCDRVDLYLAPSLDGTSLRAIAVADRFGVHQGRTP